MSDVKNKHMTPPPPPPPPLKKTKTKTKRKRSRSTNNTFSHPAYTKSFANWCISDLHDVTSLSLTHWGRVTHTCISNLIIIGSDNALSSGRRQAIIWIIAGILLIGPSAQWVNSVLLYVRSKVFHDVSLMYDKCSSGICLMYDKCSSGICLMYESLRT